MTIKEDVKKILIANDRDALLEKLERDRKVVTALNRLLFDMDELVRWRAVKGLGWVAVHDPYLLENMIGRLVYTMNDDAGQIGWMAPQALGEMCASDPDLVEDFFPLVISAAGIDAFRAGVAWAIGRVGTVRPDLVEDTTPLLLQMLTDASAQVRGLACWALGRLGLSEARKEITRLTGDNSPVSFYDEPDLKRTMVSEIARAALEELPGD